MKKNIAVTLFVVLLLAVNVLAYFAFIRHNGNEKDKYLVLYGNVDIREVNLGFRVYGKVKELFFDEGDRVKLGDKLATLDDVPYVEEVSQARANVESLESTYQDYLAKLEKREGLSKESISKEDFDDAVYNAKISAKRLEEAKAALASALTRLEDTQLNCPSSGTILSRIKEPGSVLNVGEPVFTVSLDSPVWIRAYVNEPDLGKVYPGMTAEIYTDTKGNPTYFGHVGFISPVAEFTPKNVETTDLRTDLVYRLRIILEEPDEGIRQGMPVTVKLKL